MLKSGDKAISTVVRRSAKGLELQVRLHEAVEEFMRASAGEEVTPIELFGRKWQAPTKLLVYDLPESMKGVTLISSQAGYRLDRPGNDLFGVDPSNGLRVVNMSFTRLVGASAPAGITFTFAGAFDREDVIWLAGAITEAGNVICKKYIYPMIISTENVIRAQAAEQRIGDAVI